MFTQNLSNLFSPMNEEVISRIRVFSALESAFCELSRSGRSDRELVQLALLLNRSPVFPDSEILGGASSAEYLHSRKSNKELQHDVASAPAKFGIDLLSVANLNILKLPVFTDSADRQALMARLLSLFWQIGVNKQRLEYVYHISDSLDTQQLGVWIENLENKLRLFVFGDQSQRERVFPFIKSIFGPSLDRCGDSSVVLPRPKSLCDAIRSISTVAFVGIPPRLFLLIDSVVAKIDIENPEQFQFLETLIKVCVFLATKTPQTHSLMALAEFIESLEPKIIKALELGKPCCTSILSLTLEIHATFGLDMMREAVFGEWIPHNWSERRIYAIETLLKSFMLFGIVEPMSLNQICVTNDDIQLEIASSFASRILHRHQELHRNFVFDEAPLVNPDEWVLDYLTDSSPLSFANWVINLHLKQDSSLLPTRFVEISARASRVYQNFWLRDSKYLGKFVYRNILVAIKLPAALMRTEFYLRVIEEETLNPSELRTLLEKTVWEALFLLEATAKTRPAHDESLEYRFNQCFEPLRNLSDLASDPERLKQAHSNLVHLKQSILWRRRFSTAEVDSLEEAQFQLAPFLD